MYLNLLHSKEAAPLLWYIIEIIESFGLEGTPRGHLVHPPPQRAETPLTRSGCSEPCPPWSWMFPGMGPFLLNSLYR